MEAIRSSETSVLTRAPGRYIPEDDVLQLHITDWVFSTTTDVHNTVKISPTNRTVFKTKISIQRVKHNSETCRTNRADLCIKSSADL
jgi:hypothetical protein